MLLYRPSLDFASGAGQLMQMQLARAARRRRVRAEIGCERGALSSCCARARARGESARSHGTRRRPDRLLVDHGLCVPNAAVVFVHNLATEANAHVPRAGLAPRSADEDAISSRSYRVDAAVVANSRLVEGGARERFAR